MDNFIKIADIPLDFLKIKSDGVSHIFIRNLRLCSEQCEKKPCTYYCPTRVFCWDDDAMKIQITYSRCVECGACPYGCPHGNIDWRFPAGGYGVLYRYG